MISINQAISIIPDSNKDKADKVSILFVDDEKSILNALKRVFRKENYNLYMAESAEEAFQTLSENPVKVVVSDMRMPGKNGIEFLREVKKSFPDTIRIILSGYSDINVIQSAINEGEVYRYITKPWDDEELRMTIRHTVDHWYLEYENRKLQETIVRQNEELKKWNKTLEKKVEERTRELNLRNEVLLLSQEILSQINIGILCVDIEGTIVQVNARSVEILSLFQRELMGTPIFEVDILPCDLLKKIKDHLANKLPYSQSNIRIKDKYYSFGFHPLIIGNKYRGAIINLYKIDNNGIIV